MRSVLMSQTSDTVVTVSGQNARGVDVTRTRGVRLSRGRSYSLTEADADRLIGLSLAQEVAPSEADIAFALD